MERHQLEYCTTLRSPYRSGICINRINHDGADLLVIQRIVKENQLLIRGLNWLSINVTPNINTAYSLLSQFNCNPSQGHLELAKYVLSYLKHTSSHGIGSNKVKTGYMVVLLSLKN